jgi:uncharacterized membrane protein YhaH (DUF805 family)
VLDKFQVGTRMNIIALLFSFRGRRNRARFWLILLLIPALVFVWVLCVLLLFGGVLGVDALVLGGINVLGYVIAVWVHVANAAKRLHDINWSGRWAMAFYATSWAAVSVIMAVGSQGLALTLAILSLAIIAILGAQPGTVGPNKYGADPLAQVAKPV